MAKPDHHRKPQPPGQVRINTPDGHRLRFSESLVAFVINRPERDQRQGFRLGDWIASLDDEMLEHLVELSEQAMLGAEPPGHAVEDLLSVALHASCAEREADMARIDEEKAHAWMTTLFTAALFEAFRREGLVEFEGRIGLEGQAPSEFSYTITAKGRAAGERVGKWN